MGYLNSENVAIGAMMIYFLFIFGILAWAVGICIQKCARARFLKTPAGQIISAMERSESLEAMDRLNALPADQIEKTVLAVIDECKHWSHTAVAMMVFKRFGLPTEKCRLKLGEALQKAIKLKRLEIAETLAIVSGHPVDEFRVNLMSIVTKSANPMDVNVEISRIHPKYLSVYACAMAESFLAAFRMNNAPMMNALLQISINGDSPEMTMINLCIRHLVFYQEDNELLRSLMTRFVFTIGTPLQEKLAIVVIEGVTSRKSSALLVIMNFMTDEQLTGLYRTPLFVEQLVSAMQMGYWSTVSAVCVKLYSVGGANFLQFLADLHNRFVELHSKEMAQGVKDIISNDLGIEVLSKSNGKYIAIA